MNSFVVDSSAWIELFSGTEKGKRIKAYLEMEDARVFSTGFIVAEVSLKFLKEGQPANQAVLAMTSQSTIIPFDAQLGLNAAEIFFEHKSNKNKFGLADAHVLAAARRQKCRLLTCDYDFKQFPEAIVL